jgi:signal transduction histidine kinase/phage shock protein PspC (stress-responsive transcriptional regulator)
MRQGAGSPDHGRMTAAPLELRRLYRRADRGLLGGVATGIAEHVGAPVKVIRIAFVALAFAGGLGLALYGAYWIVLAPAPDSGAPRLPAWAEYLVGTAAAVAALAVAVFSLPAGGLFVPTTLACLGGALIWRQATEGDRGRWRASLSDSGGRTGRVRLLVGGALVLAGAIIVLAREDFSAVRDGALATVVTVVGLALVTGPWWMRLMSQLSAERSERIRTQERADIAAHLHDSVLQTLALIQRNAGSPREVARLARGQERELRTLLYGSRAATGQLGEQLRTVAAEVEDAYAITVDVVLVGDAVVDERLAAVVGATREALVNAAKHSGVGSVSLYAEVDGAAQGGASDVDGEAVTVYVKDRGVGFDPGAVADDRQGLRGSVRDRMQRHGGRAEVRSAPGSGTEVELWMPVQ